MLVLIPFYKPHDTSFLDQINMMSTVFGMKHTYSIKYYSYFSTSMLFSGIIRVVVSGYGKYKDVYVKNKIV